MSQLLSPHTHYEKEEEESLAGSDVSFPSKNTFHASHLTLQTIPSFTSFNFFKDKEICILNPVKSCNKALLEGPRRVLRLCIFGFILPVILISIPLYVRLILYPPYQVSFAPTDQRLLNQRSSSIWCQSQYVHMNGSFNAYMLSEEPTLQSHFRTHTMHEHIVLKDDYKEYWGFFLLRGSLVKVDLCNRYDGGSLMIMRGVENLKKCAWIGEADSAEEDEDQNEESNESREGPQLIQEAMFLEHMDIDNIGNSKSQSRQHSRLRSKIFVQTASQNRLLEMNFTSQERRTLLDLYIDRILKLSKSSKEISDSFHKQNFSIRRFEDLTDDEMPSGEALQALWKDRRKNSRDNKKTNTKKEEKEERKLRVKRAINADIPDEGKEIDEEVHEGMKLIIPDSMKVERLRNKTDEELYKRIYKLPEGLNFERGTFNFSTGPNDASGEEVRSSFSSSEEALANCEGLLGAVPLYADPFCTRKTSPPSNRITYRIPITGTYYFVFSSDNEITSSNMFFNLTLHRVVYNTTRPKEACFNKTDCSLSFSFWSHNQAVIDVPLDGGNWNATYMLDAKCEPRVPIYLCIIILVPFVILFCAFQ